MIRMECDSTSCNVICGDNIMAGAEVCDDGPES